MHEFGIREVKVLMYLFLSSTILGLLSLESQPIHSEIYVLKLFSAVCRADHGWTGGQADEARLLTAGCKLGCLIPAYSEFIH